jgi:hypothetical protein
MFSGTAAGWLEPKVRGWFHGSDFWEDFRTPTRARVAGSDPQSSAEVAGHDRTCDRRETLATIWWLDPATLPATTGRSEDRKQPHPDRADRLREFRSTIKHADRWMELRRRSLASA